MTKRVFLTMIAFSLVLSACAPPPLTLVPIDTVVAQTMAAMPKTDTPIPPTATPDIPATETLPVTPDVLSDVPGAICIPRGTLQQRGLVTRVLDGDTIEVAIGNDVFQVNYIGVNAPELIPNIEWQGPQAAAANEKMVGGQVVTLIQEVSDTDASGALLRHVIANSAFPSYELIWQGYAAAIPQGPDLACASIFQNIQAEAQGNSIGMWAPTPVPSPTRTTTPTATLIPTLAPPAPCVCDGPALTCKNFSSQASAQVCFNYCKAQGYGDVFGLDKNENGIACEGSP